MSEEVVRERIILIQRFLGRSDEALYVVGKELGVALAGKYDAAYRDYQLRRTSHFYIPLEERGRLADEIARAITDEKLVEVFNRFKPRDWLGLGFRGRFYTFEEDRGLSLRGSWDEVKEDVAEVLDQLGERAYAFLRAIIELRNLGKWSGDYYGASYSDILARMREICGKPILPAPRDFPILRSYRLYYKSGSRKYPTHSIPEEIIPAVREALERWKSRQRRA